MANRLAVVFLMLPVALIAAACGGSAPPPAEQPPAAAPAPPAVTGTINMAEHFSKVSELEEAIVRGDLESAKTSAQWIADHQDATGVPADTVGYVTGTKNAARAVAATESLGNAGIAAAFAVSACGDCHAAAKVTPKMPEAIPPSAVQGTAAQMRAHQYAVDLMYRGMVVPSEDLWKRGAEALKVSPLTDKDLAKVTKEIAASEARVRELANRAVRASDAGARIAIYGEVIGGCANCHSLHGSVLGKGLPKTN